MFCELNVGPNQVVLPALVRAHRRGEPRFNVRLFNVGADPYVSLVVNEPDRAGFHRFQPLQKRHVVIAKQEVNVGALARNHAVPRRALRGLNIKRGVPVVQH